MFSILHRFHFFLSRDPNSFVFLRYWVLFIVKSSQRQIYFYILVLCSLLESCLLFILTYFFIFIFNTWIAMWSVSSMISGLMNHRFRECNLIFLCNYLYNEYKLKYIWNCYTNFFKFTILTKIFTVHPTYY